MLHSQNRVWQIAWVIFDQYKKVHSRESRLLRWENLSLSDFSKENTGFNEEQYQEEALPPENVLEEFLGVLQKKDMVDVTANGFSFDFYMLRNLFIQVGRVADFQWSLFHKSHDICNLYKAYVLGEDVDKNEYFLWNIRMSDFWKRGMKYGVETICRELGIEYDLKSAHDALYDAEKTKECFDSLRWKKLEN